MRDAATIAEQFSQIVRDIPYHPGHPGFMPPNGQLFQLPPAPVMPPAPTGGKRKTRGGEEGGEDVKKKRKTKPKDPNAPKRPASSYLLFQNDVRQELKAKNPHLPNNELLNLIAKAWGEMPKEQKDVSIRLNVQQVAAEPTERYRPTRESRRRRRRFIFITRLSMRVAPLVTAALYLLLPLRLPLYVPNDSKSLD